MLTLCRFSDNQIVSAFDSIIEISADSVRVVVGTYVGSVFGLEASVGDAAAPKAETKPELNDNKSKKSGAPASSVPTMKSVFSVDAHIGSVKSLAATLNGRVLVSGGNDETIRIYD